MRMNLHRDYSLLALNTFGIDISSKYFVAVDKAEVLLGILSDDQLSSEKRLILGGGSNILFTENYDGLVLKNELCGIHQIKQDQDHVWVEAQGGEVWHNLVGYCLQHNLGGIENLSLIPGSVGAAPIQNIGAYGVELKDCFDSLQAMNLANGKIETFSKKDCEFDYRNSIFKQSLKGKYFILSVILKLNKKPQLNLSYGAIKQTISGLGVETPTIQMLSEVVCEIRQSKLPDPAKIGNCGSFFKNAIVPISQFNSLQQKYPSIPHYPVDDASVKIPTAWLIEQCGWKGKRVGNTGAYKNQALVLVNHGGASGQEVYALARKIQASVAQTFGIEIDFEVNII